MLFRSLRPGMYIGKLGDGTQADDGIYVLIKEVVDNSQNPRATRDLLDGYIDDENTDIDELTDTVMGFLKSANATKRTTKELLDAVEKEKQRVEEEEARKRELMA